MASLRDIRRRIGSIRNIAQITRAMEMVAASRMKRAQEAILAARPFTEELDEVLARVSAAVDSEDEPLLARRPVRHVALIMVTTDRGLAGALNSNAVRNALRWVSERADAARGEESVRVSAITVGRKGRDALRRAGIPIAAHFPQFGDRPTFSDVQPLGRIVIDDFLAETYDEVVISFSSFVSTLVQRPAVRRVLPVERPSLEEGGGGSIRNDEYLFEPSAGVLSRLLPFYVITDIYRAVLENIASEHSARMIAMRNSTDNAHELMDELTLVYNKTRQATITREMIEIASGAEAQAS